MVSAVITAGGKNRRMIEDLKSKRMYIEHKLLMDIKGKAVIVHTIENILKAGVDECTVVLGHFSSEISLVLENFQDNRIKIITNSDINVELSETLLNGVKNSKPGLILCAAGDQPTVTAETYKKLIDNSVNYPAPSNLVSVLARKKIGQLDSAEGLGMPFICHSNLLLKYLSNHKDNLNPVLRDMIGNGVIFYGIPPLNDLELVNINRYQDYLDIKNKL